MNDRKRSEMRPRPKTDTQKKRREVSRRYDGKRGEERRETRRVESLWRDG